VVDRLDLGGRSHKQRRIGAVIHDGHVRARTLPDDPALDDLRTDWGEVEYVPAADLKGAVSLLERMYGLVADRQRVPQELLVEVRACLTTRRGQ
jgi:hypothetical protein